MLITEQEDTHLEEFMKADMFGLWSVNLFAVLILKEEPVCKCYIKQLSVISV